MNALHTVEIVSCIKRQMRDLHHKMMDNLDNKFNPIDVELDSSLDKQIDELNRLKAERDNDKVESCLKEISYAIENEINIMPSLINAAENYVTMGEMVSRMKVHFGIYEESAVF